jgi:hypothetical protein
MIVRLRTGTVELPRRSGSMGKLATSITLSTVAAGSLFLASHLAMSRDSQPGPVATAPVARVAASAPVPVPPIPSPGRSWSDPPVRQQASARPPAPIFAPIPMPAETVALADAEPEVSSPAPVRRKADRQKVRKPVRVVRKQRTVPTVTEAPIAVASYEPAPPVAERKVAMGGPVGDILKGLGFLD